MDNLLSMRRTADLPGIYGTAQQGPLFPGEVPEKA
jgi:hypothetical protein